jgi:hypothetical protein
VKAGYRLYEQAKKQESARKVKEEKNPEGCTFKPHITRGSSSNNTKGQERFNSLHQNAVKREATRKTLVENRSKEGCTFKPDINDRSKKMNKNALTGSKRFDNLYNDAQKRRAKTQAEATTSATAGCTFTPRITKRGRQSPSPSTKDRFSLLYESNKRKSAAELEAEKAMRETKDCTFKPRTTQNTRSRSAPKSRSRNGGGGESYATIHERLFESGKENRAKLDKQKQDNEEKVLDGCTFKPSINHNPNRQQAIEQSHDGADPFERLHRTGNKEDILAKLDTIRQEQAQQCTFKPRIIRRSVSAGKQRPGMGRDPGMGSVSVYDRLHSDMQVYERRSSELREKQKVDELANCTFAPETNYDVILSRKADLEGEPRDLPVWERLQQNRQGVQMLRDEIKKQKDMEGCTFTPEVGREPLRREQDQSIHERLSKQAKNYAMLSKLQEKNELDKCTFHPKTNVNASGAGTPLRRTLAEGEHIWDRLSADVNYQERDRELEAKRKQLELEGCTFQPRTTASSRAEDRRHRGMSPEKEDDEASWTKDEIMDRLNSRIETLSQPRDSAGSDRRKQIEQRKQKESKMPGYQRPGSASRSGRSQSAGRSRPSSASKERAGSASSSRSSSRGKTRATSSNTTPSKRPTTSTRSSSASRARPSSSSKIPSSASKSRSSGGSGAPKSTDKFSDWQKEMEEKMQQALDTSGTTGSAAPAPSGGAESLESFNSWQAEIEAKMKDL